MSKIKAGKANDGHKGLNFAKALEDCSVCCVLIIDAQKKVAACSAEAAQLLDLNKNSLQALPPGLRKIIRETISSGKPTPGRNLEVVLSGGRKRALRISAMPLSLGPKNSGVALVLNNLTSARELEQKIVRLDRLASIGTLSASMAHEIKNALVAVKTFIQLVLEKQHQDTELVEIVRREMARIESLVSQMLKFAAPSRPAFSPVRLHEILDHSLRLVRHQLDGKLISLNRSYSAASDLVRGDDYQLEQAFVNLFLNAVEAMGHSGELFVRTESINIGPQQNGSHEPLAIPSLRVIIRDSGIGISPETRSHLFEPFFTTKQNGTGLGLPITRRIIQEHQGDISVQSEPNQGATFSVMLPALDNAR